MKIVENHCKCCLLCHFCWIYSCVNFWFACIAN